MAKIKDLPKIERPTLPFRSFSEGWSKGGEKNNLMLDKKFCFEQYRNRVIYFIHLSKQYD